ncbi:MAG: phosphotransferase family protein [Lachnospiraceae bacterium]|nr:phosphotransferase family protein [Lachnospiraceae bacterium]
MAHDIVNEDDLQRVRMLCENVLGDVYCNVERLGGRTNHTYHVKLGNGREYAVRIPGEGTEELIVREDERISTNLACDLDIDAKCLYFGQDGSKVTEYIPDAVTMSSALLKEDVRIIQMAEIFRRLHGCGQDTGVPFEVFQMAAGYEKIISEKQVPMYTDYQKMKSEVMTIKAEIDKTCDIRKVPCHNDPLCENWVTEGKDGRMYLIDWEYAGMNDGMWDLADVSIEAEYDKESDEKLLREYLGRDIKKSDWKHFMANKIYVDFLWTLWAKTRVPYDGKPMEDWAIERYERLKYNVERYQKNRG